VRTLEEREAAYAEARLRILGSAVSTDEELIDNNCDYRSAFITCFDFQFLFSGRHFLLELGWDTKSELLEIVRAGFLTGRMLPNQQC